MKKTLFAVLTLLAVLPAAQAACTFSSQANGEVNAIIKAHGNWPVSDAQCCILSSTPLPPASTPMTFTDGSSRNG